MSQLVDALRERAGYRRGLEQRRMAAEEAIAANADSLARIGAVQDRLAAVQAMLRADIEQGVYAVVSRGLTTVFGEPLRFGVELGFTGDVPNAQFSLADSRGRETRIMDARGGGYVNVAAFLLRVRTLLHVRPPLARFIGLDESFANVSEGHLPRCVTMLREIVERGQFQIILITHRPGLEGAGDVGYRFDQQDGWTIAEPVGVVPAAQGG